MASVLTSFDPEVWFADKSPLVPLAVELQPWVHRQSQHKGLKQLSTASAWLQGKLGHSCFGQPCHRVTGPSDSQADVMGYP